MPASFCQAAEPADFLFFCFAAAAKSFFMVSQSHWCCKKIFNHILETIPFCSPDLLPCIQAPEFCRPVFSFCGRPSRFSCIRQAVLDMLILASAASALPYGHTEGAAYRSAVQ